ncbi:hypothetical protein PG993_008999 [Apiospora rasikravindrae]|uniref:Uncharacterized protein n=1 Tax=Apiospora rasikravindrae TaxID=990691 RepID=A0ABR1SI47_9PEZI
MAQLPEYLLRGLGPLISTVKRPAVKACAERIAISDVEVLSSYNWVNPASPATIMVPGGPRVLRSPIRAVQLEEIETPRIVDPHITRLTQAGDLQPLFQAVEVLRPECRFDNVDVLASRVILMKLVKFCGLGAGTFRLNASVIRNSLILQIATRAELENDGVCTNGSPGYGPSFEEAVTAYPKGLEDSHSHWRILRYNLGPLKCVIRYESDATTEPYDGGSGQPPVVIPAPDDISATVLLRGHLTSQEDTVEIKSTSNLHVWQIGGLTVKTWAGCTGHLLLGRHFNGQLEHVTIKNMQEANARWCSWDAVQPGLFRLLRLISELKQAVRAAPSRQATLIFRAWPRVQVDVYDAGHREPMVSPRMTEKFWGRRPRSTSSGTNSR